MGAQGSLLEVGESETRQRAPKETTPIPEGFGRAAESEGKREAISFVSPQSGLPARHVWLVTEHSACDLAPFHVWVAERG